MAQGLRFLLACHGHGAAMLAHERGKRCSMEANTFSEIRERLQRERRNLVEVIEGNQEALRSITETSRREFEEHAQRERDADALEGVEQLTQKRLSDIDAALARIDGGQYAKCENCGQEISEARLRAEPTVVLCAKCSEERAEAQATAPLSDEESAIIPGTGKLPPDLDILDDQELAAHLEELIRDDGRIDMHELRISAQKGVIYLEGALPSEPEHQMLLNFLTDVAGIQEIIDHLEIQRLAWERSDRSKPVDAQDIPAANLHQQEPYGGTDDINLTQEEGVSYEPPEKPPPPPHRKD